MCLPNLPLYCSVDSFGIQSTLYQYTAQACPSISLDAPRSPSRKQHLRLERQQLSETSTLLSTATIHVPVRTTVT